MFFLDTLIPCLHVWMIQTCNFRGGLTDVSVKTVSLLMYSSVHPKNCLFCGALQSATQPVRCICVCHQGWCGSCRIVPYWKNGVRWRCLFKNLQPRRTIVGLLTCLYYLEHPRNYLFDQRPMLLRLGHLKNMFSRGCYISNTAVWLH